jgi:hypothetical protein
MITLFEHPKDILSIEYHFEEESLDLEIRDPQEITVLDTGYHMIKDEEGYIFVIRPEWIYVSIITRKPKPEE